MSDSMTTDDIADRPAMLRQIADELDADARGPCREGDVCRAAADEIERLRAPGRPCPDCGRPLVRIHYAAAHECPECVAKERDGLLALLRECRKAVDGAASLLYSGTDAFRRCVGLIRKIDEVL